MMQCDMRMLRYLAIATCACLLLSFLALSSKPASAYGHISSSWTSTVKQYGLPVTDGSSPPEPLRINASIPTTANPKTVQQLWRLWAEVFEDARPKADPVRLASHAGIAPVARDDTSPREPPIDRISNPESDIEALHEAHSIVFHALRTHEIAGDGIYNGTGIVIVGGGEYFGPAIIGIQMLRRTGSTLPVEVFVADESEWEDYVCTEYLPKLGAKCLITTDFLHQGAAAKQSGGFQVTHYQLKSLAMLFCSFAEVLYLDSDSIPLVDPATELFSQEPYASTGLVIWPDFWVATESPRFYRIVGIPGFPSGLPKSSSEAGQLLINKKTHLKTLLLANYYNIYGPDYYYPLLSQGALGQGDKETFLAAALVLGEPWYRVKANVDSVRRYTGQQEKGSGMVQYHPQDDLLAHSRITEARRIRPAFLHANTPKMNAGHLVDEGDLMTAGRKARQRLRLWGSKETQVGLFGFDAEKTVWDLLVQTGCELEHEIGEWTERPRLCERLKEHWEALYSQDSEDRADGSGRRLGRNKQRRSI